MHRVWVCVRSGTWWRKLKHAELSAQFACENAKLAPLEIQISQLRLELATISEDRNALREKVTEQSAHNAQASYGCMDSAERMQ